MKSNSPSPAIFDLVQTMSVAERRMFKKNIASQDALYGKLFALLCDIPAYDEAKIKKKLGSTTTNQLAVLKNYLYEMVLDFLVAQTESPKLKLLQLLERIEMLYERRLFSQCQKVVNQARKLYQTYELEHEGLKVERWAIDLALQEGARDYPKMEKKFDTYLDLLQTARLKSQILQVSEQLNDLNENVRLPSLDDLYQSVENLLQNEIQQEALAHSWLSIQCIAADNASMGYSILGKDYESWKSAQQIIEKIASFSEKNPALLLNTNSYLGNYLLRCIDRAENQEIEKYLPIMWETIRNASPPKQILYQGAYYFVYLKYLRVERRFEEVAALEQAVISFIPQYEVIGKMKVVISWWLNFAISHFELNQYPKAQEFTLKIHTTHYAAAPSWLFFQAMLIDMMIYFEEKEEDLQMATAQRMYRFIEAQKKVHTLSGRITLFFKNSTQHHPKDEQKKYLLTLLEDIQAYTNPARGYLFDFERWAKARLERLS